MGNEERVTMPLLGESLPEMTVQTTHGEKHLPADYKGKWFVLFSHPGDFTPVCTTEFMAFQQRYDQFKALNCELIGLSEDQVFSHIKWGEWIKEKFNIEITFPIIADNGAAARKLGMIHPAKGTQTVRAVFIVDAEGIVRLTLYYPQEVGRNFDEIVRCVKALQTADKFKIATPADWPHNAVLGENHVMIPAPRDIETIEKRKKQAEAREYNYVDWWFCHKELK
ncbi:peroxiredoxin (alkyl hydroperoxide reductase subunit C) [Elusimicrobium posterum]|uniref:peroxiredoxin n=1 Tax=Elusimicrobium posterum TaxID=3116653 RepID=UPI003C744FF9